MPAKKSHRVFATNPQSKDGEAREVVRGNAKYFLIVPIDDDLFEIHYGGKYLGESTSLSGAESFIKRGGASAPVLIKNPNGGYEMYHYKSPGKTKTNPKKKKAKKKATKKRAKKKTAKKKATKKRGKKKATKRKSAKKKVTKKKATKKRAKKKTAKKKATKKRGKKKVTKRKSAKKKTAKKKTTSKKRKSTTGRKRKKTAKKAAPKTKTTVDAAVRGHITKKTGSRPNW